ncbi:prolipoprotein diacylglyceryl transferase [Enterobacteriaceae endosymbiont of Plateumaris consimilis]|uniref:prolipoprotein diacylglyceryl transferase n=1 Tax=Enterobacteriaceae endosymbiont of Plateumaris consimilis TaxID=2675794 RepID=UPI001449B473|nr:prolipoprotein diacylglyceryl transferase [Enterobacteriaceae endosymbiont of Plateumaris consimilis]QJC28813.1 prolipoprotein diacylglyceryl transferase [Enterobacteriaceae endosymbiont of Plateumaris consimilis]
MNIQYLSFPQINPIAITIYGINIYWYSLMYLISFLFIVNILKLKSHNNLYWNYKENEILLYLSFIGLLLGGRLGYTLFYNLQYFLIHPISLFQVREGGMSFHGGLIGAILVIFIYSIYYKKNFLQLTDFIVPLVPLGLGMGRIGNFINGELWGRVAINIPWAIIFPNSTQSDLIYIQNNQNYIYLFIKYGNLPRHPSQIYEFFLEGLILFIILNIKFVKRKILGYNTSMFLLFYGIFRIFVEFFREPDVQLGLFFNYITMGQILSLPMVFIGFLMILYHTTQKNLINSS